MKNDFENEIRKHLANYEEQVPQDLWADIERRTLSARPSEKRVGDRSSARVVVMRRWVAGVAASVAVLVGGWLAMEHIGEATQHEAMVAMAEENELLSPDVEAEVQNPSDRVGDVSHVSPNHLIRKESLDPASSSVGSLNPERQEAQIMTGALDMPSDQNVPNSQDTYDTQSPQNPQNPQSSQNPQNTPPATTLEPSAFRVPTSHSAARRPSFSLRSANLLQTNAMGSTTVQPMLMSMAYASPAAASYMRNGARMAPMYLTNYEEEADHRLPLAFGLNVRLPMTDRLWVESGLSYSIVSSTFTHRLNAITTTDEQRLYYVGIPVNVGYNIWQTGRLKTYVSGGVQGDVCVKSTMDSQTGKGAFDRDRMQFSFTLSAGVEYELLPHSSLYFQPGFSYYPDNGSRLQNIFKEKPLLPSLQFGVRYSLQ